MASMEITKRMKLHSEIKGKLLMLVLLSTVCLGETSKKKPCHDADGNTIPDGSQFTPDRKDPCQTCHCDDGFSIMCTAVSCSPPECDYKAIEGKCCEFICEGPQPSYPQTPGVNGTGRTKPVDVTSGGITNLGLRLVASTITSFLVLALLLFMIHKLRQRRLLISIRRLNSSRRRLDEVDHERYINEGPPLGFTVPPYQDPPPPYSPPKPPTNIAPGEPPPPYEAINNNCININHAPNDLPPAYRQGASNIPVRGGACGRVTSASESSCTSDSEFLSPPLNLRTSALRNETGNDQSRHQGSSEPSVPDNTNVKELVHDRVSAGGEISRNLSNRSLLRSSNVSNNSSNQQQTPDQTSREAPHKAANIFGPRYIKKSGSVEILRQSSSPRNSYCLDGMSAAEVMSQSLDPSMLNRMLNSTSERSTEITDVQNNSPVTGQNLTSEISSEMDASVTSGASNQSLDGVRSLIRQMDAADRRKHFRLSNLLYSPVESTESPTSPLSPVGTSLAALNLRSNSLNSELSWFSVCSETGEPRLKKTGKIAERNYPGKEVSKPLPERSNSSRGGNSRDLFSKSNRRDLARNYSTEMFDGQNRPKATSLKEVHRSASDNALLKRQCKLVSNEAGECSCRSCRLGEIFTDPWEKKSANRKVGNKNKSSTKSQSSCANNTASETTNKFIGKKVANDKSFPKLTKISDCDNKSTTSPPAKLYHSFDDDSRNKNVTDVRSSDVETKVSKQDSVSKWKTNSKNFANNKGAKTLPRQTPNGKYIGARSVLHSDV